MPPSHLGRRTFLTVQVIQFWVAVIKNHPCILYTTFCCGSQQHVRIAEAILTRLLNYLAAREVFSLALIRVSR